MTSELPWFRCFPDRLLAALGEMDADTQHVYVTLLLKIYARGGPVKDDPRALATFCRRSMKTVRAAVDRLAEMGRLTLSDGMISNHVAEAELDRRNSVSEVRSRIGKQGGRKSGVSRSKKREENQGEAEPIASHERTDKTREDKKEAANAASAGARDPPPDVIELRTEISRAFEAVRSPVLPDTSRAAVWLAQGYRPDIVVAVVREVLARKPDARDLRYFDRPIAEAHTTSTPTPQPASYGGRYGPHRKPSAVDFGRADIERLEREERERPAALRIVSG